MTQAGQKLKGLKYLLKGGDPDKVINFARNARQNDVYIMAANFLQN